MYKAIIFDFFGVFCPDITLEWFKKNVSNYEEKLQDFHGICTKSDYGKLSKANFYQEISVLTGIEVNEIIRGVEAEVKINKTLVAFVEELKSKGYLIACLSNGTQEWTLDLIKRHNLDRLFDHIVLSGDLGIIKPDAEIYEHTLDKLEVKASEAVFIDDRPSNVEAAEDLGIRSFVFTDTEDFIASFLSHNK